MIPMTGGMIRLFTCYAYLGKAVRLAAHIVHIDGVIGSSPVQTTIIL